MKKDDSFYRREYDGIAKLGPGKVVKQNVAWLAKEAEKADPGQSCAPG